MVVEMIVCPGENIVGVETPSACSMRPRGIGRARLTALVRGVGT